jgi:predicted metalloprotease
MYIDVSFLRGEAHDAETFFPVALVVIAHEAGHAWEDQNGYAPDRGSTVVNRELFADCFSGAVMAAIRGSLEEAKRTMYSVGDYAFDRRSHHGTPDQRREAVEYGAVNGHEACDGYLRLS